MWCNNYRISDLETSDEDSNEADEGKLDKGKEDHEEAEEDVPWWSGDHGMPQIYMWWDDSGDV